MIVVAVVAAALTAWITRQPLGPRVRPNHSSSATVGDLQLVTWDGHWYLVEDGGNRVRVVSLETAEEVVS
jgi:hypothetical protein